ncbi:hypothetical protein PM082_014367 [Marasmius tenuissimus]|nr:hypothetical protein PM082_014367 [Marasmius tenuissimus]
MEHIRFDSANHDYEVEHVELLISEPFTSVNRRSVLSADRYTTTYKGENMRHGLVTLRVWRDESPDAELRALFLKRFQRELLVWKGLDHPNIAPLHGLAFAYGQWASSVAPYYQNGTISKYLKSHPQVDPLVLLHGVAKALAYLHSLSPPLCHGDVRGRHIFVNDEGIPVLTNVGINQLPVPPHWTFPLEDGIRWTAPEIILADPKTSCHKEDIRMETTPQSDVYGFGMTMFEVFTGGSPYRHRKHYPGVIQDVITGVRPPRPSSDECPKLTNDIWNLVEWCWNQDPTERPSATEVERTLAQILSARETRRLPPAPLIRRPCL